MRGFSLGFPHRKKSMSIASARTMPVFPTRKNPRQLGEPSPQRNFSRAATHPLREQKFFAARRRQPGMKHALVRLPVRQHIPEEQRVADSALVAPIELGEVCFAALIILIEIDEEGQHALAKFGDLL